MATFISLNHYDLVEVAGVGGEKKLQGQLNCGGGEFDRKSVG